MPISLFYWYTDIDDVDGLADRLRVEGERLKLGGRIRVSPEGINATVGGDSEVLDCFHAFICREMDGGDIDFKMSDGGGEHFENTLQVRKVREVVTLGDAARKATWRNAAPHITPEQFRDELLRRKQIAHKKDDSDQNGSEALTSNRKMSTGHLTPVQTGVKSMVDMRNYQLSSSIENSEEGHFLSHDAVASKQTEVHTDATTADVVLLDARNSYETAIGRFDGAIVPNTRQFAQFGSFVRENRDLFKGKRVLMYCTGGVRCERGSAVVSLETEAESIAQLKGGIDAFLKQFPDGGGVFKGRNLVFDKRITQSFRGELSQSDSNHKDRSNEKCADAPAGGVVLGKCISCRQPWDDYSAEWRCSHCRCRVLLCDRQACVSWWKGLSTSSDENTAQRDSDARELCEDCVHQRATKTSHAGDSRKATRLRRRMRRHREEGLQAR